MSTITLHHEQDQRTSKMAREAMDLLWRVRGALKDTDPDALVAVEDQINGFMNNLRGLNLRKLIASWPEQPTYPTKEQISDYNQQAIDRRATEAAAVEAARAAKAAA